MTTIIERCTCFIDPDVHTSACAACASAGTPHCAPNSAILTPPYPGTVAIGIHCLGRALEDVVGGRDNLPIDLRIMQDGVEANPLVRSISKETDILHLAGPTSQTVLAALNPAAGKIPFLGMAEIEIGGVLCKVFRITFTGCMGYEIHVPKQEVLAVYETIAALDDEYNIGRMGSYAINSLRIEKAFALKADLDFAHYKEAGINFFVSKTKDFKGKDTEGVYIPERRRVSMVVETANGFGWSVPGDSPVYRRDSGELVGFTTTSALGGITGKTIAMGYFIGGGLANAKSLISRDDLYVTAYGEEWALKAQLGPVLPITGRE